MTPHEIAQRIRTMAASEGFARCGIAHAVASDGFPDLLEWIEAGYAGGMEYFANRIDAYRHPNGVLPGAKSLVVLAMPYDPRDPEPVSTSVSGSRRESENPVENSAPKGRVARYAWQGTDYHDDVHPKVKRICRLIQSLDKNAHARGVVDTAPLMEREVAQLAGLGWRGKNTLLLNRHLGSYFFLACVLVDIDLPADLPHATSHCGTCTACLDACPTDAFVGPYVMNASKCISYLTIESRESIAVELRSGVGDWLFGCDVCQEVCPWNRKPARRAMNAAESNEVKPNQAEAEPDHACVDAPTPADGTVIGQFADWGFTEEASRGHFDLLPLFGLSEDEFRLRFRKSPMWRTRRRGLLRNAAIVLGNIGGEEALPVLQDAINKEDVIVAESAQWAVDQILGRVKDAEKPG